MKYERLTKYKRGDLMVNCENCEYEFGDGVSCTPYNCYNAVLTRLAELEDALESGKMIRLPCKVGDTVYCIYRNAEYEYWIEEELVHDFIYTNDGEIDIGTECRMLGKVYRYCVYLTKSEAEKKLKECLGK